MAPPISKSRSTKSRSTVPPEVRRAFDLAGVLGLLLAAANPARAAPIVSQAPAALAVTLYRGSDEAPDSALSPEWLRGYALVTETREVDLPAGVSTVRFEGVAGGMLAESAIVSGLPAAIREKNLDAALLSPGQLYARLFGRPVILRRSDPVTGQIREESAVIRSGADGAAVLETARGFEAVNCGSTQDDLVFPAVPQGLSARPSLSVEVAAPRAVHARLTLSYLAWGFDWRAHYALVVAPDGRRADLTGWVTVASSDGTTFPSARLAIVAGKPQFAQRHDENNAGGDKVAEGGLMLRCRPRERAAESVAPPLVAPPAPMAIMVTAMRKAVALRPEDLGDLKLFRLPFATTLAAHAQKQVALLDRRSIRVGTFVAADLDGEGDIPAMLTLRTHNRAADGLGFALPSGAVSLAIARGAGAVPLGESPMDDKAMGETIEWPVAASPAVQVALVRRGQRIDVTVTNRGGRAVAFEATLPAGDVERLGRASATLAWVGGKRRWIVAIAAHGQARLHYALRPDRAGS